MLKARRVGFKQRGNFPADHLRRACCSSIPRANACGCHAWAHVGKQIDPTQNRFCWSLLERQSDECHVMDWQIRSTSSTRDGRR